MLLVFISIAFGGFLVLIVTLVFGGDSDADVDHDFDTDADADHDTGGGHHWLSLKVLSAFATAFGAGGSIARAYGMSVPWSLLVAVVCGLVIGAAANAIIVLFFKQQTSSDYSVQDLIGKTGLVILDIQPGRYGEVQVRIGSAIISRRAKTQSDNEEIKQGQQVTVVAADTSTLLVKRT